ncbi:E3 ubiquitin-protein ligase BOI-like isoform X1 [Alnus glutinosa]|uniref:E3 ubiquitin-protein ligase BOI-like isoform X1 n=1 Tax=Alnus glutinosa TaxID=3517 RepID=UPI002D79F9E0|nr:E3 ubiquitin-protein ligase BOI-like isoform X1 [Alnus glutinosa]
MFGGDSSNPVFPTFLDESQFQYVTGGLPQLQLFGDFTVGCSVGPLNYMGNNHTSAMEQPTKRAREAESISRQQKHLVSLNNNFSQDKAGQSGSILNPNPVSTGLKLAYEEDEHNSSVTSASESMTAALPVILSLSDNLKTEIDRQNEEFDCYIRFQEENILKDVRELKQRHTVSFLSAIEKVVDRKLHEKELEIENMNRKNKELMERIKQIAMEVQSWHYRAKYNESVVNALKSNLQRVMAQGAIHGKEGCGDSEVDDAASYANVDHQGIIDGSGNSVYMKKQMNCRACKVKEVCVLLIPCRHLCLCKDCEGFIDVCPICQEMKTASAQVFMS